MPTKQWSQVEVGNGIVMYFLFQTVVRALLKQIREVSIIIII